MKNNRRLYIIKVMLVNGSSHIHGTTMAALEEMIRVFEPENIETEVIQLRSKPIATSTYWNMVHGLYADEAPQDEEGMQTVRNLARNMIWMMRSFALARENEILYPDTETEACTNFIKRNDNQR